MFTKVLIILGWKKKKTKAIPQKKDLFRVREESLLTYFEIKYIKKISITKKIGKLILNKNL
jgi:hypothetical protein